jgi:ABC-type amino acid transport system permease subunit
MNHDEPSDAEKIETFVDGKQVIIGDHNLDKYFKVNPKNVLFSEWLQIAWGYFWRGIVISILAGFAGIIIGAIIGFFTSFIATLLNNDIENIKIYLQVIGFIVGLFIGLLMIIPLIKWILKSRFGKYRFLLIELYQTQGF